MGKTVLGEFSHKHTQGQSHIGGSNVTSTATGGGWKPDTPGQGPAPQVGGGSPRQPDTAVSPQPKGASPSYPYGPSGAGGGKDPYPQSPGTSGPKNPDGTNINAPGEPGGDDIGGVGAYPGESSASSNNSNNAVYRAHHHDLPGISNVAALPVDPAKSTAGGSMAFASKSVGSGPNADDNMAPGGR